MNQGSKDERLALVIALIAVSVIVLGMISQWNDHARVSGIVRIVDRD